MSPVVVPSILSLSCTQHLSIPNRQFVRSSVVQFGGEITAREVLLERLEVWVGVVGPRSVQPRQGDVETGLKDQEVGGGVLAQREAGLIFLPVPGETVVVPNVDKISRKHVKPGPSKGISRKVFGPFDVLWVVGER